jgi:hypothetical protein
VLKFDARLACALVLAVCLVEPVLAQAATARGIYTCVDEHGRRFTSDRPIPQCLDREQALRNRDGSVRGIIEPSLTAEERAARDEALREKQARDSARRDAMRKDRNLLARYPDQPTHDRARTAAIEPILGAQRVASHRAEDLRKEAVDLHNETEFYQGRKVPTALLARIDANRAAQEAQQSVLTAHQQELDRLNRRYDQELAQLRRLWSGTPVGQGSAPKTGH